MAPNIPTRQSSLGIPEVPGGATPAALDMLSIGAIAPLARCSERQALIVSKGRSRSADSTTALEHEFDWRTPSAVSTGPMVWRSTSSVRVQVARERSRTEITDRLRDHEVITNPPGLAGTDLSYPSGPSIENRL
jgi:hypothetical protein